MNKNQKIISPQNKNIAKYSSDLIKKGLELANKVNKNCESKSLHKNYTDENSNDSKTDFSLLDTLNNLGLFYINSQMYEEAVAFYDNLLETDSNYAIAWNNKAAALLGLQKYQEAIYCCDKAISVQSDFILAWRNRGVSLQNLENFREALNSYK